MNSNLCQWWHPNCCLTLKQLEYISNRITADWKRILRHLPIEYYVIEALEEDSRLIYCDSKEVAFQALLKWYQLNPKKASFCKLKEALTGVGRGDIILDFEKEYPLTKRGCDQSRRKSFIDRFFVGRQVERNDIIEFCQIENKDQLLVISALPGLGKTALVKRALNDERISNGKLNIFYPNFLPTVFENNGSGLENFAAALYEQLCPGEYLSQNRMATLYNFLTLINEPSVLVIDVSFIYFPESSIATFWKFVARVLSNNLKLKVIVLCCKTPDYYNLKVKHIPLREMQEKEAVALLRHQNSLIRNEDCIRLFKVCGGNPCILRKIAAHISNFKHVQQEIDDFIKELEKNPERERLQVFIQQSFLKNDMKLVFEQLEVNEKKTLICLSNFPGFIPIFVIDDIFDEKIRSTAEHLWQNHCILERTDCGGFFQMSEIMRSFVKSHCQDHSEYISIMESSKVTFIKYYLKILWELDEIFLSPNCYRELKITAKMIDRYRKKCKVCINGCCCELMQILFILFQKVKSVFLLCVNNGLSRNDTVHETIDICCKSFQFLRSILADEELQNFFENLYFKAQELKDKLHIAVTISNLVFTKAYHKVKHEKALNIKYLSEVITCLENEYNYYKQNMLLQLALCYVNRGYLKGFYDGQFKFGVADLETGKKLLLKLPQKGRVLIALYSVSGYLAALYYQSGRYGLSIHEREKQVSGYRKTLGIHPFTAKAIHYQGQAYAKVKDTTSGINCCLVSYQMYRKLKGNGVETMRVLSSLGKILLNENRVNQGIRNLEKAIIDGTNALGEHKRVAWCYDQLISAKQDMNDDPVIIEELIKRRDKIQSHYDINYELQGRKHIYSIQKSVENLDVAHFLEKEEVSFMKFVVPMLIFAVLIRLVFADRLNCFSV